MKKCLMTCAIVLGLAGIAAADEPNAEAAEIRAEFVDLKNLLQILNDRIERLEQRLIALDTQPDLLPWQKEQPFLWDGIHQRERMRTKLEGF